jgi:hypothetical protein
MPERRVRSAGSAREIPDQVSSLARNERVRFHRVRGAGTGRLLRAIGSSTDRQTGYAGLHADDIDQTPPADWRKRAGRRS